MSNTAPTYAEIETARRAWKNAGKTVIRAVIDIHEVNPDDPFGESCWRIEGLDDMLSTRDLVSQSPPAIPPPAHPADWPQRIMSKSDLYASKISLAEIRLDGGTQPRVAMDQIAINDYAGAIRAGVVLPPVTIFDDGKSMWLADGFHRYAAAKLAEKEHIWADIKSGTQRDAVLYAVGANTTHGLRRTSADKRRAIERLLLDPEWRQWSDAEIARRCAVDPKTVATVRAELNVTLEIPESTRRMGKDGRLINIANIGGRSAAAPAAPPVTMEIPESTAAPEPEMHDATPALLRAMLEHINQTADIMSTDRVWLRDHLVSAGKKEHLRVFPSQAAEAIQQFVDDENEADWQRRQKNLAAQRAQTEAAPAAPVSTAPELEPLPVWKLERTVSDWAEQVFPDPAKRLPALFGIKIIKDRSEHWKALTDTIGGDQPYRKADLIQAICNVHLHLNQQVLAATSTERKLHYDAVQAERSALTLRTRTETIEPAAAVLAAELAAGKSSAWSLVYRNVFGIPLAGPSAADDIIATLAAQWLRQWLSPGTLVEPERSRREITKIMMLHGVTPPWLKTEEDRRFAQLDCQLGELDEWISICAHKWASSRTLKEKLDEANSWVNDLRNDVRHDGPGVAERRMCVNDLIQRLTDLSTATSAINSAGINQNGWYAQAKRIYDAEGGDLTAICANTPRPIVQYAAAVLPAGARRDAVLAVLHDDRLGGKP